MTKKDELFSKLQEFKAFVENQTGKKIKVLQSDNGGEYTLNVFKEFCAKVGMRREIPHHITLRKMGWSSGKIGP